MSKQVVVYMSPWCGTSTNTQRALTEWGVPAKYINIKEDRAAAARVREWVGFESVPTVVIAEGDGVAPFEPPAPLPAWTRQSTSTGCRPAPGSAQPLPP